MKFVLLFILSALHFNAFPCQRAFYLENEARFKTGILIYQQPTETVKNVQTTKQEQGNQTKAESILSPKGLYFLEKELPSRQY